MISLESWKCNPILRQWCSQLPRNSVIYPFATKWVDAIFNVKICESVFVFAKQIQKKAEIWKQLTKKNHEAGAFKWLFVLCVNVFVCVCVRCLSQLQQPLSLSSHALTWGVFQVFSLTIKSSPFCRAAFCLNYVCFEF